MGNVSEAAEYNKHAKLLIACANDILAPQGREFIVDDDNRDVLRFLLYYFNQCPLAMSIYPDSAYSLDKNIFLCGEVGVGKTLMMDAFSMYLQLTNNPNAFRSVSVTQLLNWYKLHENIDYYTYNTERSRYGIEGNPFNVCLHDIGLQNQKYYGQNTQLVVNEFFYARDEIYTQQFKKTHVTTNLDFCEIEQKFDDGYGRLIDRFKNFNIIALGGESRR